MKKLNLKLVAAVVSFVASVILITCWQKAKICVFLACLFLAICLVFYALYRQDQFKKTLIATEQDLEENPPDEIEQAEIRQLMRKAQKKARRLNFTFYTCAFLVFVVGVFSLF